MIQQVPLTLADTEYSVVLPTGTRAFFFKCRDATKTFRFSDVTGKVAGPTEAYVGFAAGQSYTSPVGLDLSSGSLTLYFGSAATGAIIEVISYK